MNYMMQKKESNCVSVNELIQRKKYNGVRAYPPVAVKRHSIRNQVDGVSNRAASYTPKTANHTGLPDQLKAGVENFSGFSMNDVRVHCNSAKPAQMQALAYTQGSDIHIAPGQEQHLPHEAWHVVQQKRGRVRSTFQLSGAGINTDPGLEREADQMGQQVAGNSLAAKQLTTALPSTSYTETATPNKVVQRTEIDAKNYVRQNWADKFAKFGVIQGTDNYIILLLKALWDARAPEFGAVFKLLVQGLRVAPGAARDGEEPLTLHDIYQNLIDIIGLSYANQQFSKYHLMQMTSDLLFQHYEPSKQVDFGHFSEKLVDAQASVTMNPPKPGIGVVALIPTHSGGKSPGEIAAIYGAGFPSAEAKLRFGLAVGVNEFAGLGEDETAAGKVTSMISGFRSCGFPVALIGFTWKKPWQRVENSELVRDADLINQMAWMNSAEKEKVNKKQLEFIPHGYLREVIVKASKTKEVKAKIASREGVSDVYYHIADDDAPSVKTLKGEGVYTTYQNYIRKGLKDGYEVPALLAGGYRVRREDNCDRGDIPAQETGTELSEIASDIDHLIRNQIARLDPRIPYLSEANLLVNADALDKKITAPQKITGEIFGGYNFESGNLKRFLGLNALTTEEAQAVMDYVYDASIVTGTKGGGKRFYEYKFRKPENYYADLNKAENPVSWQEIKTQVYKNALSISQNIGAMGNLAINLSLYFKNTRNWVIPTGEIANEIEAVIRSANLPDKLADALLQERSMVAALREERSNRVPSEAVQVITQTVKHALEVHAYMYEQLATVLYTYIQSYVKAHKSS